MENGQNDDYCIMRFFDGYQGEKLRNVNIRESNNCFWQLKKNSHELPGKCKSQPQPK